MNERGSARMLRDRGGKVSDNDLALVEDLSGIDGVDLVRWWWRGQPAIDLIHGAFRTDIERVGDVVSRLLQAEAGLSIKVFPRGIPVVDGVLVEFGTEIE